MSIHKKKRWTKSACAAGEHFDLVHLTNVDHVLKVDPTGSPANYTKNLPFPPVLKAALNEFGNKNL